MTEPILILSVRKQDELIARFLEERLNNVLPDAMREARIDMWLVICQEDDLDPVFMKVYSQMERPATAFAHRVGHKVYRSRMPAHGWRSDLISLDLRT